MPIMLTTAFGQGPIEVGMIIFPGAIIAVIAGQFIGKLIDRFGNAPLIILGQLFLLGATILFALLSTSALILYFQHICSRVLVLHHFQRVSLTR